MTTYRPTVEELGITATNAAALRYLWDALHAREIPFLLIRDVADRPALAVDGTLRAAVGWVFSAAVDDGFGWTEIEPGVVRFGEGVDVEFWEFRGEAVRAPRVNAFTRKTFELNDVEADTIELLGLEWQTIGGMFDAHSSDVDFEIDMVFSWVDGTDAAFRARRAALLANAVVGEGDDADARIRQIDELRYALRSVHTYAPWVRRIFVATDCPAPAWLAEDPKVTVVNAEDHFSDLSSLPVFNSHAVESQLHHIDGLAEHFLYSNDDMFFARPVRPSMFFTPGGVSRFIEAGTRIGPGVNHAARSGFENAARVNRELLHRKFGHVITRHLEHTPAPLRRSVLEEMETEFPAEFARTRDSRFRSATDISVTNSLYHYYALFTGRAVPQDAARMRYVDTTTHAGLATLAELATRASGVDFFCLNDGSFPEVDEVHRVEVVSQFLADYFPESAPWERLSAPFLRRLPVSLEPGAA